MFKRTSPLPSMPIYTLTWNIGEEFGGLTSSAVQRTNAFARSGHRKVEFLTLSPNMDPKVRGPELKRQGKLHRRVRVRNIWNDLCSVPDDAMRELTGNIDEEITIPKTRLLPYKGRLYTEKSDKNGAVVQTDYFREDGSVFASDMLKPKLQGRKRGRLITVFTSSGSQLAQWSNISEFYYSWLDKIIAGQGAVLITDSAGIGGRMRNYERPNVVKAQVQHNCHLANAAGPLDGPLTARWKNIIINSDKYDFIALLTDREREDLALTQLNPGNLVTIPNMFRGSAVKRLKPRAKAQGITVSRLSPAKQVDHAIQAVASISSARLDIYGSGPDETPQQLADLIDRLGVGDRVIRHGYDPFANERFRDASFSILSSRSEGQGLVLLESMAAGCIPIAYDIRYGPSDIITHGVNGFLVSPDSIEDLSRTIELVISLPDDEIASMRRAAVKRARDFSPESIVRIWAEAIRDAMDRKAPPGDRARAAQLLTADISNDTLAIEATVEGPGPTIDWAAFAWVGRDHNLYGRIRAQISGDEEAKLVGSIPIARLAQGFDEVFDFYIDIGSGNSRNRIRLSCADGGFRESEGISLFQTERSDFSVSINKCFEVNSGI